MMIDWPGGLGCKLINSPRASIFAQCNVAMRGVGDGLSRSFLLTGYDEPASLTRCKTRLYNLHCEFGPQASRRGPENCISHFGFVSVKSEQLAEKPFRGCKWSVV